MGSQTSSLTVQQEPNKRHSFHGASISFHNLHSPKECPIHKDYLWKKWKFTSKEKASIKYNELKLKQSNAKQYEISVLDVEMIAKSKVSYEVKAKVEFSDMNLKSEIERRSKTYSSYNITEIWNITKRLTEIAVYLTQNCLKMPQKMNSYLIIGSKIKVKDYSLLPGIKTQKSDPFNYSAIKIICRMITNLGLLVNQSQTTTLIEINKMNLKYNPSIATFLYTLLNKQLSPKQILQLVSEMRQQNKISTQPIIFQTKSKTSFNRKHSTQNWIQFSNCVGLTDQKMLKHSSVQTIIAQKSSSSLNFPQCGNFKRVQEIKPKQFKQSKISTASQSLQQQNKQNKHSNIKLQKKQSVDNIEIDEHNFPQRMKLFRKTSVTTLSDISSSRNIEMRNSEARNEAFIRLTGGQKCELFAPNHEQSLLESIIQSQESIIVRSSESPVLNLDHEIESITQQFLKMQDPLFDIGGEEQKSILQFQYRRNSTIMEVTQENQQSGEESKQQQIKSQSQNSAQKLNFQDNNQEQEQQLFVIEEYQGGSQYEGYTVKGIRNGFGKLSYEDGGFYQGHWKNGQIEGFGKLYYQSGELAYQGNWRKGQFHGQGKVINESPEKIVGKFNYQDFSDIGTAWLWYEGNFQYDNKHGSGTLMLSNGQKFTGNWHKNNVQGAGIFFTLDKKQIHGQWFNNLLAKTLDRQQTNQYS